MNFSDFLKDNLVCLDGGMGTQLQQAGLRPGERPECWNLTHPAVVTAVHRAYFEAGSHVVCTNTFGANTLNFSAEELPRIVEAAVRNAAAAREEAAGEGERFIALDIGPTGRMLKPYGDLDFEDAVAIFAETVRLGVASGVDLILIETMADSYETKAALLAAKENATLPILVSNAYGEDGKLLTGATPAAMVAMLEGMGADAVGANCSLGPRQLAGVVRELLENASVPVLLKPNAGLPRCEGGKTLYDIDEQAFAEAVSEQIGAGVRLYGGCCGTTPAHIRALSNAAAAHAPKPLTDKNLSVVSSYTHAVTFGARPLLIGERINPTGKKRFKQALLEHDIDYLLGEGFSQAERGADILDVNVGIPGVDEPTLLTDAVCELQAVLNLPLQIDTSDPLAMERALRRYNGKAMVNSVNGKEASMRAVFPLVKKYGGLVVALTLDENGIPDSAEGRLAIAERIVAVAAEYGIPKKNLIFDPLAMAVSAERTAGKVTLDTVALLRERLGCLTSLGISNVSFGLPCRDAVNATFFALAMERGLSAAIINPYSDAIRKAYFTYMLLHGLDENCAAYMQAAETFDVTAPATGVTAAAPAVVGEEGLQEAIRKGRKAQAAALTAELLKTTPPLEIVNREILPALDAVGVGFEQKTVYLPQLLMSAEAAQAAFACIKQAVLTESPSSGKGPFVLATVEGDIHDIGKNIVKLLLENYGYTVVDLGRDVPPAAVLAAVREHNAPLLGLSALMTTTVPAMEESIRLVREGAPACRIVVGGAVLNADYAAAIGADRYAADAMETVRYAEGVTAE